MFKARKQRQDILRYLWNFSSCSGKANGFQTISSTKNQFSLLWTTNAFKLHVITWSKILFDKLFFFCIRYSIPPTSAHLSCQTIIVKLVGIYLKYAAYYFNICNVHLVLFCSMTNKCTINWQIITLLHVSTLLCHPQGDRSIMPSHTSILASVIINRTIFEISTP
jgi:hypothetical protein